MTNEKLLELWRNIPTPDGWQMDDIIVQYGQLVMAHTVNARMEGEVARYELGRLIDSADALIDIVGDDETHPLFPAYDKIANRIAELEKHLFINGDEDD